MSQLVATDSPLSFCMVTTFFPPYHFGGEAMYIHRVSNELAKRGHRVTVIHCVDSFRTLTKAPPRGEFALHENVTVHRLKSRLGPISPLVTYLSGRPGLKTPALRRILGGERFDVVHFHLVTLFGPGVIDFGGDATKLYTTHDHWLVCPMYDLWKQNRELCEKPECLRCTLSFHRPPQLWRYTGLLERELRKVDLFLSPSQSTIEQHRRRGFSYPMRHLPYFLPLDEATAPPPAEPVEGPRPGRPYFLFVGRLVKLKGAQTLIEAFRRYDAADLLLAGDGIYGDELRRQAEGLEHVRFLGRVHPDALRALYAGATAVLVPSLVYETFGFITLEALAQRTPVIATELGAVGELARESGGGLTYRGQEELVAAMERLRTEPGLRDELGERGYAAFVERWSEQPHVERYLDLVTEAREQKHGIAREAVPA
jgi:glycosyltransferase involved in cell wall biosynthesis